MGNEIGRIHVVDVEAGATVPPEGHFLYARDTDKVYKSDGTTLTELASGGGAYTDEQAQDAVGAMVDTSLIYTDSTPLLQRAALTGDVTASAGSNATTIANDAVTYAKIQNVTDARLLGRSAGSSGDAQEITVGSSLDLSSGNLALPSWRNKYDPMRPPSSVGSGGVQDEFIGGSSISFSWGNQQSSTATDVNDGLVLYNPAGSTGRSVYWFTGPDGSSTDWVFHVRLESDAVSAANRAGICILCSGTTGSPTIIHSTIVAHTSLGTSPRAMHRWTTGTGYTSAESSSGVSDLMALPHGFLRQAYVSSTKVLTSSYSYDGYQYKTLSSNTLAAHPTTTFGLQISSGSGSRSVSAYYHFVRIRTDSDMLNPGS